MKQQIKCLSAFTATQTPNYYTGVRDSEVNIFRLPPIQPQAHRKNFDSPENLGWKSLMTLRFSDYDDLCLRVMLKQTQIFQRFFFTPNTRLLFKKQKQSKGESQNIE